MDGLGELGALGVDLQAGLVDGLLAATQVLGLGRQASLLLGLEPCALFRFEPFALRPLRGAVENMQQAQAAMMKNQFAQAEQSLHAALKQAPNDYCALLLMSNCYMAQNKSALARQYANGSGSNVRLTTNDRFCPDAQAQVSMTSVPWSVTKR